MAPSDESTDRLDVLQLLRGVAALAVCMLHALTFVGGVDDNPVLRTLRDVGASGVDLFFCISGFVMAYTTRRPERRTYRHILY